jgi:hypothetical protein
MFDPLNRRNSGLIAILIRQNKLPGKVHPGLHLQKQLAKPLEEVEKSLKNR